MADSSCTTSTMRRSVCRSASRRRRAASPGPSQANPLSRCRSENRTSFNSTPNHTARPPGRDRGALKEPETIGPRAGKDRGDGAQPPPRISRTRVRGTPGSQRTVICGRGRGSSVPGAVPRRRREPHLRSLYPRLATAMPGVDPKPLRRSSAFGEERAARGPE